MLVSYENLVLIDQSPLGELRSYSPLRRWGLLAEDLQTVGHV